MDRNTQKQNRQKFLNIIYFVDSSKTKTFKFSLNISYIAAGILIFTILWSLVSTILLFNSYHKSSLQSQRVRSLLATIFNYQTRYDQVYEKTYPNDGSFPHPLPELSAYDQKAKPDQGMTDGKKDMEDSKVSLSAKSQPSTPTTPKPAPTKPKVVVKKQSPAPKTTAATPPQSKNKAASPAEVKLDKYRVSQQGQKLALEFAIKNLIRPNKANGYVVGYAKFIGIDGTSSVVASPPNLIEGQKINKWKLPRNHRFSIRYYTQKVLLFDVPDKRGGTFESIKIIVGGKNNDPLEFVYNIKGSEGAFAPVLESIPNTKNDESSPIDESNSQGS